MQQNKGEQVDVWYQRLQDQVPPCSYRDNFILKMYDQEMAGKLSGEVKTSKSDYTAEKALQRACELQQNKSANTFLQSSTPSEVTDNQVLAMGTQRSDNYSSIT